MPQLKRAGMKRLSLCISEKDSEQVAAPHSLNSKKWSYNFPLYQQHFMYFPTDPTDYKTALQIVRDYLGWIFIYIIQKNSLPLPGNEPQAEIRGLCILEIYGYFPVFSVVVQRNSISLSSE